MWGSSSLRETSSLVHKRVPSKDRLGRHESSGLADDDSLHGNDYISGSRSPFGQHCTFIEGPKRLMSSIDPPWRLSLPHICVATLTSFLFGYHMGVVNEPLESIALDLGFSGDTLAEGVIYFMFATGLVVSTCLAGAFFGCLFSGWIADAMGRRRSFQISALPMVLGASISALANNLDGMLIGRFLVGTGMGLGPTVASLYVAEVSPSFVRGTYGSFIQIATCLGLIGALFIGIPAKEVLGW
ncbi:hypothetical protein ACLOJK_021200 [Asimina triloba]